MAGGAAVFVSGGEGTGGEGEMVSGNGGLSRVGPGFVSMFL